MTETNRPVVLSAARFISVRMIDGGDTIAASFQAPDGREVAMLVPRREMLALQAQLADLLLLPVTRAGSAPG